MLTRAGAAEPSLWWRATVQQLQALVCAVQGSAAAAAIWSQSSGGSATHDATEV